jgi:hypothetical protein
MRKIIIEDYIGKKYGRLTILREGQPAIYKSTKMKKVVCVCECGIEKEIDLNSIKRGKSTSCGCYNKESASIRATTHGKTMLSKGVKRSEYSVWVKIKSRCTKKSDKSYCHYGGRGIKVCDRWINSFENFIEDMGYRPNSNYSIERIDYNKDYCPENCKWIHKSEQPKNMRRVKKIEYKGLTYCLTDLCEILNLPYSMMRHRIYDLGLSFEEAIKYPKNYKFRNIERQKKR